MMTAHVQMISDTVVQIRCSDRPEDDDLTSSTDMRPSGCIITRPLDYFYKSVSMLSMLCEYELHSAASLAHGRQYESAVRPKQKAHNCDGRREYPDNAGMHFC